MTFGVDAHSPMGIDMVVSLTQRQCDLLNDGEREVDRHGSSWRKVMNEIYPQHCWPITLVSRCERMP